MSKLKSGSLPPGDGDFYKKLIDNLYDGVYYVDRERVIVYWNTGAERITGYSSNQVVGHACSDNLLNHVTANGVQLCQQGCPLSACMEDGINREAEVYLHHADGHRVPVLVRVSPIRDGQGQITGAVEIFSDNTGMMAVRRQLRDLHRTVTRDALTGIGNRQHLEAHLRAAIADGSFKGVVGVLFMDIDRFKDFNDTFGHEIGDQILRMVAATLQHNLRTSDVIGRWGGEEFLAILEDTDSMAALSTTAEKLRLLVKASHLTVNGQNLSITLSVGGTLLLPGDTMETVVNRADELMYRCKRSGRNCSFVG